MHRNDGSVSSMDARRGDTVGDDVAARHVGRPRPASPLTEAEGIGSVRSTIDSRATARPH